MTDIPGLVERLRDIECSDPQTIKEAADAIEGLKELMERLRGICVSTVWDADTIVEAADALERMANLIAGYEDDLGDHQATIARLEAEIALLKKISNLSPQGPSE